VLLENPLGRRLRERAHRKRPAIGAT
jgi:hypothetical protein